MRRCWNGRQTGLRNQRYKASEFESRSAHHLLIGDINMYDSNDYSLGALALLANICQVASFHLNVSEITNDEIMKHLQKQDNILNEQTNIYLKKIIKQNEEILDLLKKLVKNEE